MTSYPLRISVIYLLAIMLTVLNLNDIFPTGSQILLPVFDIMIIYYFASYRNGIFGFWFVFLLGIWSDSINGSALGMTSLIYLITIKIFDVINQKQPPKENFGSILKEFIIFLSIILLLKWLFLSIYYQNFYSITNVILQIILSSICYLLMHKIFDLMAKKLLQN